MERSNPQTIIKEITSILSKNFGCKSFVKGSYGYGIPHDNSDIDIQISGKVNVEEISRFFDADLSTVVFKDSSGESYNSTTINFRYKGYDISLVFDDHPKVFPLVQEVTQRTKSLPVGQRYIIRLISGGLKYDSKDAYKVFLDIFKKLSAVLDPKLVEDIKAGKMIDRKKARIIAKISQIIYINEVGCGYEVKLL